MRLLEQGRTRLLGAAIGTCLVTAVSVSGALAQEATPVPSDQEPSTQTAEATPAPYQASAGEKTALAEQIQRVTDTIATVQADRDAVGGTGDWTAVDDLLAKSTQLRDTAKATLDGDDISPAYQQLAAAEGSAMAAESLIRAQLSDYGLPSQQAGASRTLVAAYNQIVETGDRVNAGTDETAKGFVTTAQNLYKTAYDLYSAGTYAQAARTADVATQVASLGDVLTASFTVSTGGEAGVKAGGAMTEPANGQGGDAGVQSCGATGEPANGQDVVIVEGGTVKGGGAESDFDPKGRVVRGETRPGEPSVEFVPGYPDKGGEPGFAGAVVVNPFGGLSIGGPGYNDFSTESPLEVPAPSFD